MDNTDRAVWILCAVNEVRNGNRCFIFVKSAAVLIFEAVIDIAFLILLVWVLRGHVLGFIKQ
jgi:hypothetical protein